MKFAKLTLGLSIAGALAFIGCDSDSVSVHGSYHEERHVYRREYAPPRPVDEADTSVSVRYDDRDAPRSRYDDDNSAPQYDTGDRVSADPIDEPVDQSDATYFEDDLHPYGDWVVTADFGRCWRPHGVAVGWRPYSVGHWVYTDEGWLWASDEPYGWATYHYGRWYEDGRYGWVWVPGRTWAPAWVAWRHGGGCAGWAPLPPVHSGTSVSIDIVIGHIHPDHYCFVDERYIDAPRVHEHVRPVQQNVTIINNTTNITNITTVNNKVVNRGVDPREVESASGHKVQKVAVVQTQNKGAAQASGDKVAVFKKDLPPKKKAPVVETKKPTDDRGARYAKPTDTKSNDRGQAQTLSVPDKNKDTSKDADDVKGKKPVHTQVEDAPKKPTPPKTIKPDNDVPRKHTDVGRNDDPKYKKGGDDGKTDKNYRASDDPRDVRRPSDKPKVEDQPKGKKPDNGKGRDNDDDKGKKKGNDRDSDTDQNVR